jgi:hypothetical protein
MKESHRKGVANLIGDNWTSRPVLQMSVAQRPAPISNVRRCYMALRQEIATEAVGNLAGIDPVVLLLCCRYGPQHYQVCDLHCGSFAGGGGRKSSR